MQDDELDIKFQIKEFLSKENQFRNPKFDPAPFIIDILKQKQANQEHMIQKQNDLIQMQNQAQQLIDQVCGEYSQEFMKLLDLPMEFGEQLQKLKSNISIVKKKIKQTKSLLQNTQKDIEQIHFNCLYNKIIYRKLKEIQLRLHQYETASLALKNNQFMKCSMNLTFVEGTSILQSTLASRSQILKLRMISKAIEQINIFMYLSPKVVTPSSNIMLERANHEEDKSLILNWNEQQPFYKRYKLFKKAHCLQYLQKIWKFDDVQRREGKIAMIYDIIKGSMNIGKISQISNSIKLNANKLISNIYFLLKCFYIKDNEDLLAEKHKSRWFTDKSKLAQEYCSFMSNVLNISGVIFRKLIIIRKIYKEFMIEEDSFHTGTVFNIVIDEIKNLIQLTCFPAMMMMKEEANQIQGNIQSTTIEFRQILSNQKNYILYGCTEYIIRKSIRLIHKNIQEIEENEFKVDTFSIYEDQEPILQTYNSRLFAHFHKDFIKTIQEIFNIEGRSFTIQLFDSIIDEKQLNTDQIKFMRGYCSDDKKAIKQYVFVLSFLKSLQDYFMENKLSLQKYYKYCLFMINFFYLKLNYHFSKNMFSSEDWKKISNGRKLDKKLRQKQMNFESMYKALLPQHFVKEKNTERLSRESKIFQNQENQYMTFKMLDRLNIFKRQNQMMLAFFCQFFTFIPEQYMKYKQNKDPLGFSEVIEKHEPANYESNIKAKLLRIWDSLPDSEKYLKQGICIIIQKIIKLHMCINTKIYLQTGVY